MESFLGHENSTHNTLEAGVCCVVEEQQGGRWRGGGTSRGENRRISAQNQWRCECMGAL